MTNSYRTLGKRQKKHRKELVIQICVKYRIKKECLKNKSDLTMLAETFPTDLPTVVVMTDGSEKATFKLWGYQHIYIIAGFSFFGEML